MCCLSEKVSKMILIILNIVFFVLGVVLIALAAVILTDNTDIFELLSKLPIGSENLEEGIYGSPWLYNGAYMMISAGAFFFVVGGAGLFGACCKSKILLIIYATILFLIIVLELGIVALAILYGNQVVAYLKDFLQESIQKYYVGLTYVDGTVTLGADDTGVGAAWDLAQIQFKCCGAYNSSDYESTEIWPGYYTVSGTNVTAVVPLTCCTVTSTGSWPSDPSDITFDDISTCVTTADDSVTNTDGCYDSIYDKLKTYSTAVAAVAAVVGIVEISGLWSAISLHKVIGQEKVNPI